MYAKSLEGQSFSLTDQVRYRWMDIRQVAKTNKDGQGVLEQLDREVLFHRK